MLSVIAYMDRKKNGVELVSLDGFHFTGFQTIRDNKIIKNTYTL